MEDMVEKEVILSWKLISLFMICPIFGAEGLFKVMMGDVEGLEAKMARMEVRPS